MRILRIVALSAWCALVVPSAAGAQVSCANPDDLCTGDPCTISANLDVLSPCTVDFGARALVIAAILRVPDGGTMSLTAASILQQGPIDGRHVGNGVGSGAAVTLIATAGDVELRGDIDVAGTVATGSIDVQASGDIVVEDSLIAKPVGSNVTAVGGNVALDAGGTIFTDQTALIDVQAANVVGGVVAIDAGGDVTLEGRIHAEGNPGGTVTIASSGGFVSLDRDVRVQGIGGPGGLLAVTGQTGIAVTDKQLATSDVALGGTIQLTSAAAGVFISDPLYVGGASGGQILVSAPNGVVQPTERLDARATTGTGGIIDIQAEIITLVKDAEARSKSGNGGTVHLAGSQLVDLAGGDAETGGKIDGGSITLESASGDVRVARASSLTASGTRGNGGSLTIDVPVGALTLETKVALTGNGTLGVGGQADVFANSLTITRARFDADGRATGGELRFQQSGIGNPFLLEGTFEARKNGTIEALATSGDLTVRGKLRAAPAGCIGLAAGGTLNTTGASTDVPVTPSCP